MVSKFSWHTQCSIPHWLPGHIQHAGVGAVKLMDFGTTNPLPGVKIVGRLFEDDAVGSADVARGVPGAKNWFARWAPEFAKRPFVWVWEGPNEVHPLSSVSFMQGLNDFTAELAILMNAEGWRLAGFQFSCGWPYLAYFNDPQPHAAILKDAVQSLYDNNGYVGTHAYSAPSVYDRENALCMRIEHIVREWKEAGAQVPYVIISEGFVDGGVIGNPKAGWKGYMDEQAYLEQLAYLDGRYSTIPEVLLCTPFVTAPHPEWMSFEIDESISYKLAEDIRIAGAIKIPESNKPDETESPIEPPVEPPINCPEGGCMEITVEYSAGENIIVGDFGVPGFPIGLVDPWGNTYISTTGAKLEWGVGGFEFLAPHPGTPWKMTIGGYGWEFGTRQGVTKIIFGEIPEDPAEPDPPECPDIPEDVLVEVIDRLYEAITLLDSFLV